MAGVLFVVLLGTAVVLILASYHTEMRGAAPMMDVDLVIPASLKPFNNSGSRLAVETQWTLTEVTITNHVLQKVDARIPLQHLAGWASALDGGNALMASAVAIEKLSISLNNTMFACSIGMLLATGLALASLALPAPRPSVEGSGNPYRARSETLPFLSRLKRALFRMAAAIGTLTSTILIVVAAIHLNELVANVHELLPALVRKIKWLCVTHSSDECQITFTPRWGLVALVAAVGVTFLTSAGILAMPARKETYRAVPLYIPYDAYHLMEEH